MTKIARIGQGWRVWRKEKEKESERERERERERKSAREGERGVRECVADAQDAIDDAVLRRCYRWRDSQETPSTFDIWKSNCISSALSYTFSAFKMRHTCTFVASWRERKQWTCRRCNLSLEKKLFKIAVRQCYRPHVTCIHDFSVLILPFDTKIDLVECDLFDMSYAELPSEISNSMSHFRCRKWSACNQKKPGPRGLIGNAEAHRAIASHRERGTYARICLRRVWNGRLGSVTVMRIGLHPSSRICRCGL